MENTDIKMLIEKGEIVREKFIQKTIQDNSQNGVETDEEQLRNEITIRPLGEIYFEKDGEKVKKAIFSIEVDGQPIDKIYDEDFNFLGVKMESTQDIMLSNTLSSKTDKEQEQLKEDLESLDWEAQTLEELKEQQKQQEQEAEKENEPDEEETEQETEVLPGLDEDEPQLTKEEVNRLTGPKTSLNQIVDNETLGNIIGLQGQYMQIVDADKIREKFPELPIPSGQRTIPIEIFPNGTANIIGEDKLKLSSQEGLNSTEDHVTATNEGTVRNEQNLETYNITSRGGMHTIAVGYDENGGTPMEIKYGWRDIENPSEIAYTELETVHEGPLQQDADTQLYKQDGSKGIDKGQESIEDAVETYARAMNIRIVDEHGYPTSKYDLEAAKQQLEERWAEDPEATLEELIEEDQHMLGPNEDTRRW